MTINEIIKVLQAHKEGKEIEYRYRGNEEWWTYTDGPRFNFDNYEFRVKPEAAPKIEFDDLVGRRAKEKGNDRHYTEGVLWKDASGDYRIGSYCIGDRDYVLNNFHVDGINCNTEENNG